MVESGEPLSLIIHEEDIISVGVETYKPTRNSLPSSSSPPSSSNHRLSKGKGKKNRSEKGEDCFGMLPDELIIRIHSYLDPPTVGRTAQVCKRFNELSHDIPLWREFSGRMNWNTKRNNVAQSVTRTFYVQKFLSFRHHKRQAEEREMEEMKRQRRQRNVDLSASAMLLLLFARPYEWICTWALILFTIFGVLKLDENIDWPWAVVFIPLLVVIYQMFFAPVVYDLLRAHFAYDFEDELAPEKTMRPIFFFLFFLMPLQSGRPLHRFLVFTPILSLVVFFLLLLIRLSGVDVVWWLVFLPLLVFGLYMIALPLLVHNHPVQDDSKWVDHVVPSFASLLLFLFFLFLFLKVDGVLDWSWFVVMAPLFVLKGFLICAPMLMTFFSYFCCSFWMVDHSRWPADASAYCIVAAAVAVMILGPLLAFEILIAQRLEGVITTSYALIFIPIFLLEGIGVCGCCALNLVVLFE